MCTSGQTSESTLIRNNHRTARTPVLLCKAKRQHLLTCNVSRYCLLALHPSTPTSDIIYVTSLILPLFLRKDKYHSGVRVRGRELSRTHGLIKDHEKESCINDTAGQGSIWKKIEEGERQQGVCLRICQGSSEDDIFLNCLSSLESYFSHFRGIFLICLQKLVLVYTPLQPDLLPSVRGFDKHILSLMG